MNLKEETMLTQQHEKSEEQTKTLSLLQAALDGAPIDPGRVAWNLRGWWTPGGWYVCAICAGRIMRRGCQLPKDSTPVWRDRPEPYGVCCLCK